MTSLQKMQARELLGNLIRSWINEHRLPEHPYLENLLGALEAGENLETLLNLDPMEYLPNRNFLMKNCIKNIIYKFKKRCYYFYTKNK